MDYRGGFFIVMQSVFSETWWLGKGLDGKGQSGFLMNLSFKMFILLHQRFMKFHKNHSSSIERSIWPFASQAHDSNLF